MAIGFKQLKNPRLGLTDKITFGKLAGCRVCDVAQDHYEYLIWAEKSGYVKFQPEAIQLIQQQANFVSQQTYKAEEIDPYLDDYKLLKPVVFDDEDIPF